MDTKAVIFDMDGVLIDSKKMHYRAWRDSGRKYGFEITEEKYDQYFGQTSIPFAKAICAENGVEPDMAMIEEWLILKEEYYNDRFREDYCEDPAVNKLVTSLNESGFKTGVGSSAPVGNIRMLIEVMPCGGFLNEIVSGDDVSEGKPNPEVFLLAAEKLGVLARKCAVIEDSLHGLKAAKSAGMAAIAITTTHKREELLAHADMVVDSLDEVCPEIIDRLIK